MQIQDELIKLEEELNTLKLNKIPIEEQIERYTNALKKITETKKKIDALTTDIKIIENEHELNKNSIQSNS